jgi:manganese/iron transport system ATP-binding protein
MSTNIKDWLFYPRKHLGEACAIELSGLEVQYDHYTAIQDIDLDIEAGDRVAVVGPNGAGKSTLLKAIAGVSRPSAGEVRIFGHRPGGHVCIAYVPQRSQVDWRFPVTVREVVMMGRIRKIGLFRWPRARDWAFVDEAMQRVDISGLADRHIADLSGGQQQRVFLAQALAQEAEIILLDEPLTGLDTPTQEAIFGLLEKLQEAGVTVLVATHDLNQAAAFFDKVVLINRRLISFGPPQQALNRGFLVRAYGGQIHELEGEDGVVVLADDCCGGDEEH